jgi:hypothetical protein
MLWQHAFIETRWRFLSGLVLLTLSAALVVLGYPQVAATAAGISQPPAGDTALAREIAQALEMAKRFDSYVWSQWFQKTGAQLGSFFAVIIGTGGLLSQSAAARLFTLSMPVSRQQLLGARAAAGLGQVAVLSLVPALVIVAVSPLVAKSFPVLDTLVYALCVFAGCAVFFSLAFFFSSMFGNVWTPVVLAMCTGMALNVLAGILEGGGGFSLRGMMHGEAYFHGQGLPWLMLLVSAGVSAALLYAGTRLIDRQDF